MQFKLVGDGRKIPEQGEGKQAGIMKVFLNIQEK
jgi:hypothetical protein